MAIVSKSIKRAREAAAAEQRRVTEQAAASECELTMPATANSIPRIRGHAQKDDSGKWQPTGEYEVGFGRPPADHRFKKGGAGGPGRPKGSRSHDSILREALSEKRPVRIDGQERNLPLRKLVVLKTVKDAAEGTDRHARKYVLDESARLFPEAEIARATKPSDLNDSDALSLAEFEAEIRHRIRQESARKDEPDDGDQS